MINKEELLLELSQAMQSQPGMNIIDVIYTALDFHCPTRSYSGNKKIVKWKANNDDIFSALKRYNQVRRSQAVNP